MACQVRDNWLHREIEADVLPWCRAHRVSVIAYEPLALGLLTGKFPRDHVFAEEDRRRRWPLFIGEAWDRKIREIERMRPVAAARIARVPQLAVGWAAAQRRRVRPVWSQVPAQIRETTLAVTLPVLVGLDSP